MRTEQASNGLYPITDDFPTCYESSSPVNLGTRLRPRRRDIRGSLPARPDTFLLHSSTQHAAHTASYPVPREQQEKFIRGNQAQITEPLIYFSVF
jgi:hypothetical protein